MIPNRKKWIPVLLTVYLVLTLFACVRLPAVFSDADDPAATVSAPLALPEDMQRRLADHTASDTGDDTAPDDTGDRETEDETAAPQAYIATRHAGASVNIRALASSDSEIVAQFYDGDPVTVLSVSGKWYQVQKDDVIGYVYQDFLVNHE